MLISVQALNVIVTIARCGNFVLPPKSCTQGAHGSQLHGISWKTSWAPNCLSARETADPDGSGPLFYQKGQLILSELGELQHTTRRIASGTETSLSLSLNNIISLQPIYAVETK